MQKLQNNSKNKGFSFTIRTDAIILFLEILKLNDRISISWFTILLLLFVPWAIGKLIVRYFKKKISKLNIPKVGDTVPPPPRPRKK